MKAGASLAITGLFLLIGSAGHSQSLVPLVPLSDRGGVSYFTGSGSLPPETISGSAASMHSRTFDASGYFTYGNPVDTAFALRLGNGVDPRLGGNIQVQAVPEPSTGLLALLGVTLLLNRRRTGR